MSALLQVLIALLSFLIHCYASFSDLRNLLPDYNLTFLSVRASQPGSRWVGWSLVLPQPRR